MAIDSASQNLYENDPSAQLLGIELVEASPEGATVSMKVTDAMTNGFGIGHGGITFLLADSAMAFASNASGGMALATSAAIDWLAPVEIGDILTARCELHHGPGKSKLWNITVTNQNKFEVAVLTARTRRVIDASPQQPPTV